LIFQNQIVKLVVYSAKIQSAYIVTRNRTITGSDKYAPKKF